MAILRTLVAGFCRAWIQEAEKTLLHNGNGRADGKYEHIVVREVNKWQLRAGLEAGWSMKLRDEGTYWVGEF